MILTGAEIERQLQMGNITLEPFSREQINPNSYNYRIGNTIKTFAGMKEGAPLFVEEVIPDSGYTLQPHQVYLANTKEVIGSSHYAMSLIGKSSMGRLGLFLQISADLGHTGSSHRWTLELVASQPIVIYPHMIIGQVSFWENKGPVSKYTGRYGKINRTQESFER